MKEPGKAANVDSFWKNPNCCYSNLPRPLLFLTAAQAELFVPKKGSPTSLCDPQYIPDSKDSSTISDSVQTPTDKDSVVPIWQDGESLIVIESLMNSLQKRLSATVRGCALAGLSRDHDPGGC